MMHTNRSKKNYILMFFLLSLSFNVFAGDAPLKRLEIESSRIRLAQDGTGIIKGIECRDCDFNMVKITPASRATAQGVEVSVNEVRRLKDEVVFITFDVKTQEVHYIRW